MVMVPRKGALGMEDYLTLSSAVPATIITVPIEPDSVGWGSINVIARRTSDGAGKVWRFDCAFKRVGQSAPECTNCNLYKTTGADVDMEALLPANAMMAMGEGGIVVTVTSLDGEEVDWHCSVEGVYLTRIDDEA